MVYRLDERLLFPDPSLAEEDGLLAIGGDLSVSRLLLAYQNGIFPWYSDGTPIMWYSPHQRFVLYTAEIRISGSMRRVLNKGVFRVTVNNDFSAVINACAHIDRKDQDGTWITPEMTEAYINLHLQGYAHSVEVWQGNNLVGGMYGVEMGKVFCGESMFSKVSNASKVALAYICQSGKYNIIDCQVYTEHLHSMGARMISREAFMLELRNK